jgi:hypothetical protein
MSNPHQDSPSLPLCAHRGRARISLVGSHIPSSPSVRWPHSSYLHFRSLSEHSLCCLLSTARLTQALHHTRPLMTIGHSNTLETQSPSWALLLVSGKAGATSILLVDNQAEHNHPWPTLVVLPRRLLYLTSTTPFECGIIFPLFGRVGLVSADWAAPFMLVMWFVLPVPVKLVLIWPVPWLFCYSDKH